MILRDQLHIRGFITRLVEHGVPCFVISCPPPRQDQECFSEGLRRETVAYIDKKARTLFQDWLAEKSVDFVDVPPETITEDGFLKLEYNANNLKNGKADPHHADPAYGTLMLQRIIDYLNSKQR